MSTALTVSALYLFLERAAATGLGIPGLRLLAAVEKSERPKYLTELARDTGRSLPSLSQLVDTLERKGLARVERDRDHPDGRRKILSVTPAGKQLLAGLTNN